MVEERKHTSSTAKSTRRAQRDVAGDDRARTTLHFRASGAVSKHVIEMSEKSETTTAFARTRR